MDVNFSNGVIVIPILIVAIIFFTGLQIFLSVQKNKWLGLIKFAK